MNLSKTDNRRRIIAGAGAVLIGVSFLLNMIDGLNTGMSAPSQTMIALTGYKAVLNAVLMIATVFGISQLLRARAVLYLAVLLAALRALSIPPKVGSDI